jgi:hypothetical protein
MQNVNGIHPSGFVKTSGRPNDNVASDTTVPVKIVQGPYMKTENPRFMLQGVDGIKNYQLHTIFASTQKLNSVNMHESLCHSGIVVHLKILTSRHR